jgi:dTMP kinase
VRPGFFLALEGLDGAGKSTLAQNLKTALTARLGHEPLILKEPTKGPYGRLIREMAKGGRPLQLSPADELDLFLRDRAYDVQENLAPALAAGQTVVMDRYVLSNVAYQGALGLDPALILAKNEKFPWPDATLIVEVSPALGLARVESGRGENGRGESPDLAFETLGYLEKVQAIYDGLGLFGLKGLYRLDGQLPTAQLAQEAMRILNPLIAAIAAEPESLKPCSPTPPSSPTRRL